mmetsp:Transcript_3944/g.9085  ORF Transcript_3944/g.9085 Transcript_3944/m.9085 type:complete len:80 (+) Transcript_3944:1195-1434(+)
MIFQKHPEVVESLDGSNSLDSNDTKSAATGPAKEEGSIWHTERMLRNVEESIAAADRRIARVEEKLDQLLRILGDNERE